MTDEPAPTQALLPAGSHAHRADLETCSDFINTLELTGGLPDEHLPTLDEALAWLADRGLVHADALRAQAEADPGAWLARLYAARAALRELWDAAVEQRPASDQAVALVNEALATAPAPEVRQAPSGVVVGHRHVDGDPAGEAFCRLARPLVDAIAEGRADRFRICANEGCRWVFEDESRAGRRRWCDMATCGNRAKVRRYRSRQRGAQDDRSGETSGGSA